MKKPKELRQTGIAATTVENSPNSRAFLEDARKYDLNLVAITSIVMDMVEDEKTD